MRKYLKEFTLLYAEDENNVQKNMIEYFGSYFKTVYAASDGNEAYKLYQQHRPEVAILDINMPELSGLEVARKIRKSDNATRIVMLTAHSEKEVLLQATEINMTKYLLKPISPFELKEALDKVATELISLSDQTVKLDEETIYFPNDERLISEGKEVDLTLKERKLLSLLVSKRGSHVTFEDIMAHVWDDHFDEEISKDSVKSQVNYLRKKIPKKCIENIYGIGYSLKV